MIVGHIGARKGSKGVPRKNFRKIAGKPLIEWSLEQLINNSKVDKVIVSTDDQEILNYCIEKGALNIGLRPKNLSSDSVSKWDVWKHSLKIVEKNIGIINCFVDLDCTSPLRIESDINEAINLFMEAKPDMVMSCCEARKNPYFNMVEQDKDGYLYLSKKPSKNIVARQQAPKVYEHAASTYVISPNYLKSSKNILSGKVIPYFMPYERCIDIDNEFDFKIVEFLLQNNK